MELLTPDVNSENGVDISANPSCNELNVVDKCKGIIRLKTFWLPTYVLILVKTMRLLIFLILVRKITRVDKKGAFCPLTPPPQLLFLPH